MPSPPALLMLLTDGPGAGGGIARYNTDLIEALAAAPCAPRVLIVCRHGQPGASAPANVGVVRQRAGRLAFAWAALLLALRLPPGSWVFCGHLHYAPLARWLCWWLGLRCWLQVHGVEAWARPSAHRRHAVEAVDLVTAVSRHTRRRLLAWAALSPARVCVVPNTVGAQFRPNAATTARVAQAPRILLTVGRLHPDEAYKGQDRIIRLLPALVAAGVRLRYRIAGSGGDQPRLERLAEASGVAGMVEFLGAVPATQLPALYAEADLFAMPSTGEGFGISFLEAMACGTPALGLAGDGSADPLADGELGTVCAEADLLESLRAALLRPVERRQLSARVHARFGHAAFQHAVALCLHRMACA